MRPKLEDSSSLVSAVIENRAKEVGFAVLCRHNMKLYLSQYVESTRTYTNTMTLLARYQPGKLVTVAAKQGLAGSGVNKAAQDYLQVPLARSFFDDTTGALLVAQLADPATQVDISGATLQSCYYLAFGAAGALLKYMDQGERVVILSGSLAVQYLGPASHMQIDAASIAALEVMEPSGAGFRTGSRQSASLYGLLNRTTSRAGAKLLRANLLQPLVDVPTLQLRYEAVAELVADRTQLEQVKQCLAALPKDLDHVCGSLAIRIHREAVNPTQRIASLVQAIILLRELLQALPQLSACLQRSEASLLQAVAANVGRPVFAELLARAELVLDRDARSSGTAFVNATQQCFAVAGGVDGILDLARSTFCSVTEQIHALVDSYRAQHPQVSGLRVLYSARAGFYLACPKPGTKARTRAKATGLGAGPIGTSPRAVQVSQAQGSGDGAERAPRDGTVPVLPQGFLPLDGKSRATVHCTTHELAALNARLKDAMGDCMVVTESILERTVSKIHAHMHALHRLVDNIALLDMLAAFAELAAGADPPYVRPRATEQGPIAIVKGRHPVLEAQEQAKAFQANDTYLSDCTSLHVITGPNMSGKSTYLRQVALIVLMAQVGSFVSAEFCSIRPVDRLFTRIGTGDSIETNSSSLMVEMQETAYIINHATPRSLVVIDELGRATSTNDGLAISWAVAEHFIALGTYTLLATHLHRLGELAVLYANAKLWHFMIDAAGTGLKVPRKLEQGSLDACHYGLLLAPLVGIPDAVLAEARRIIDRLDSEAATVANVRPTAAQQDMACIYSIAHKAVCLAASVKAGNCAQADVRGQLNRLKKEAAKALPRLASTQEPV